VPPDQDHHGAREEYMSQRDAFQPGVPCRVTCVQPDPERGVSFYTELFGWEAKGLMPRPSPGRYFLCALRSREVAAVISQSMVPALPVPAWYTHIWVESTDDTAAKAIEAGGSVLGGPVHWPGGGRVAVLADPSGAVFCAWQPGEHKGAQVVNEPGAWSMSLLNTPHPEGAKAFYGALFGWETDSFELGAGAITLWRLPGYLGGEPEQPVPRDVVGVMAQMSSERLRDEPDPYWGVDFWVDDVDAMADRAAKLGGRAVVPPHNVFGSREALLADPQGAPFTVSKVSVRD
jgi:uncharacterized protein